MMPFPGGIDSLANGTLLFSLCAALLYLLMLARPPSWRRTVAKAGAIVLLAVLALLEGGPLLLAMALLLRATGDALLAHDGEKPFLGGLASFLAAHLVYVALFVTEGGGSEILAAQPWRIGPPLIVVAAALLLVLRLLPTIGSTLRWPVVAYTASIIAMMLTAATVPAPLIMLGAALFIASDALLAVRKFLFAHHASQPGPVAAIVWVLYYLAQLLLTLGFLL